MKLEHDSFQIQNRFKLFYKSLPARGARTEWLEESDK